KTGVFMSVFGFGMGNLKDSRLEQIANNGNGNYGYLDNLNEVRRIFVKEFASNIYTIAKDVKIQVEFNPANVKAYRLIGYENRLLAPEDFKDDEKDAGEMGSGHTVTALYEIIPASSDENFPDIDDLKYQPDKNKKPVPAVKTEELLTVKLRYKKPDQDTSIPFDHVVRPKSTAWRSASEDFRFSCAVTGFAMLLQDSKHKGKLTWPDVISMAKAARGSDEDGDRAEFIKLAEDAELLQGKYKNSNPEDRW
ncbi:MAG: DUF3520 domain-containing protein, partial [Candidatus Cloacimonadaceae bacterium]|nr:DUF3520 domain-containing protein [Candidatus Cloacimonadaceae bacterium]